MKKNTCDKCFDKKKSKNKTKNAEVYSISLLFVAIRSIHIYTSYFVNFCKG